MRIPATVPPGRGLDVLGVGQNTIDHLCVVDRFPAPGDKQRLVGFEVQPGGQVATALVALGRWGARTAYAGVFGDDGAGAAARAALEHDGVEVVTARVRAGEAHPLSVILVDAASGERTVLWHRPAHLALKPADLPMGAIDRTRLLYVDGLEGPAALAAATRARAGGVPVVADIDTAVAETEELLRLVDVLFVSWPFARSYTGAADPDAALDRLARSGGAVVGVTLGAEGAVVRVGGVRVVAPAHRIAAIDTTGAGDLFHAGFMWGMLTGMEVEPALGLASAAAALECTALGGRRAIPSLAATRALAGL